MHRRSLTKRSRPVNSRSTPRARERRSGDGDDESSGGWLWGQNAVGETLSVAAHSVARIYVAIPSGGPRLVEIVEQARRARVEVRDSDPHALDRLTHGGRHQGIVARTRPFAYAAETTLLALSGGLLVALDCVQDPRNLGAILRTAQALGAAGVVFPRDRAVGVTAAAIRSAGGYAYEVPVVRVTNLARSIRALKARGWWVTGLAPGADRSLRDAHAAAARVLVVGGEGKGMRPLIARECDEIVGLPMANGVQSLNVAVAAALAMYEVGPRRRPGS
jgi:23S rRNA (guanosine2251-2'-O)-methyltransferase